MTIKNLVQDPQADALIRLVAGMLKAYILHGTGTLDDTTHLMKNIAMTCGLLLLIMHGAGNSSVDYRVENNY